MDPFELFLRMMDLTLLGRLINDSYYYCFYYEHVSFTHYLLTYLKITEYEYWNQNGHVFESWRYQLLSYYLLKYMSLNFLNCLRW